MSVRGPIGTVSITRDGDLSHWQKMVLLRWLDQHRKFYDQQLDEYIQEGDKHTIDLMAAKIAVLDRLTGELYGRGGETPYDW